MKILSSKELLMRDLAIGVLVLLLAAANFMAGLRTGELFVQNEAVRVGAASWSTDGSGHKVLVWKVCREVE